MRFQKVEPMLAYAIEKGIVYLQIFRSAEDEISIIYPIPDFNSILLIQMIQNGNDRLAIDHMKEYAEFISHLILTDVAMTATIQSGRTNNPWSNALRTGMNKIGKTICDINHQHKEYQDQHITDVVRLLFKDKDEKD